MFLSYCQLFNEFLDLITFCQQCSLPIIQSVQYAFSCHATGIVGLLLCTFSSLRCQHAVQNIRHLSLGPSRADHITALCSASMQRHPTSQSFGGCISNRRAFNLKLESSTSSVFFSLNLRVTAEHITPLFKQD